LIKFDALLIYANHIAITSKQWINLLNFVEQEGKGFVPIHCASWCFQNEPDFDKLVGGRFANHQGGIFSLKTVKPQHGAVKDVPCFEAWDETINVRGAEGALLNVHALQHKAKTTAPQRNNDWTEVEVFFNSGAKAELDINCLFGGRGASTGTAFYDEVALQEMLPAESSEENSITKGDIDRGRKIFDTHPIAACVRCHVVDGNGGPIGPPLDGIAGRKERDYLEQSLIDPQATIAEGFQAEISPMPPMKVLLTPQEFADVIGLSDDTEIATSLS
jgi:mono/diheme cytochrome c family protein